MSLRVALAQAEENGAKLGLVIKLLRELTDVETIEGQVVSRKQLTNGNGHGKHLPASTRRKEGARVITPNILAWCQNPTCPNGHLKGTRGATQFKAFTSRQKTCSLPCSRSLFNLKRSKKLDTRDLKRAKAGLPPKTVGRPRAHRADPADGPLTERGYRARTYGQLKDCVKCGKKFKTKPGRFNMDDKCYKEMLLENAQKARAARQVKLYGKGGSKATPTNGKAPGASEASEGAVSAEA